MEGNDRAATPRAAAPLARSPLVGRQIELDELNDALERVAAGAGGACFIVGEPGVGKTRLAEAALVAARERGFLALTGRSHSLERDLAYAPFLAAFGPHLRGLPAPRLAALTSGLPDLGRLFGDLRPAEPPATLLNDPALEKTRLFEAVARLLDRLAAEQPVLLFLDDLHWADRTSLELASYLGRNLASQRTLLLATHRQEEAEATQGLRELRRALRRGGLLREIPVPRLSPAAVATLVDAALAGAPPPDLVADIHRRSGGTPLFVEMLLGALVEGGGLHRTGSCWAWKAGAARDVPPLVRDVIAERLERLDASGRRVTEVLATSGEATTHAILAVAAGLPEEALLAALQHLRAIGLVVEEHDGPDAAYALSHPLLGEVIYGDLPAITRRRTHLALAGALEQIRPDDVDRLARHYRDAGSEAHRARALELLIAAGERARALYANEEASRHFAAALDLARAGQRSDLLPFLLERLGEAWERVGERAAAAAVWEEALVAYERAGELRATARLHHELAMAAWNSGDIAAVRTHLQAGKRVLQGQPPSPELADLELAEVVTLIRRGDSAGAAHAAAALTAIADHLRSPRIAIEAQLATVRVLYSQGQFAAARAAGASALRLAGEHHEPLLANAIHDQLAVGAWAMGMPQAIGEHAMQSLVLARHLGAPALEAGALTRLANAALLAGRWEEAERLTEEGLALAERVGQRRARSQLLLGQAQLQAARGDLASAQASLEQSQRSLGEEGATSYHSFYSQAIAGIIALESGDVERIRAAATRLAAQPPARVSWPQGLAILGEALVASADIAGADAVAGELAALTPAGGRFPAALAARVAGLARMAVGETLGAREHLRRAIADFVTLDLPFETARAQLELAALADDAADRESREAAEACLATFERLGARRYADRARRTLRRLGVRPQPVRRPGPGGGPLSRRELEVARLIAAGLTTAQAAERLSISPHTAAAHLQRIYERLGLNSRVALTRYLAEARLL